MQKERLDSAEAWYCPKCKEHVQATKKLDLWSTPEVLILHLKRFQYTTQSRRKIDAPVEFPLTDLDLSPYLIHQQVDRLALHDMHGLSASRTHAPADLGNILIAYFGLIIGSWQRTSAQCMYLCQRL